MKATDFWANAAKEIVAATGVLDKGAVLDKGVLEVEEKSTFNSKTSLYNAVKITLEKKDKKFYFNLYIPIFICGFPTSMHQMWQDVKNHFPSHNTDNLYLEFTIDTFFFTSVNEGLKVADSSDYKYGIMAVYKEGAKPYEYKYNNFEAIFAGEKFSRINRNTNPYTFSEGKVTSYILASEVAHALGYADQYLLYIEAEEFTIDGKTSPLYKSVVLEDYLDSLMGTANTSLQGFEVAKLLDKTYSVLPFFTRDVKKEGKPSIYWETPIDQNNDAPQEGNSYYCYDVQLDEADGITVKVLENSRKLYKAKKYKGKIKQIKDDFGANLQAVHVE